MEFNEVEYLKHNLEQFKQMAVKLKHQNHILLVELGKKRADEPCPEAPQGTFSYNDTFTVWCQAEMARVREIIEQNDKAAEQKHKAIERYAKNDLNRQKLEEDMAKERKQVALWEYYHGGLLYALQHYRLYIAGKLDEKDL